ncbi:MAG: hypothetical protein ABJ092_15995 [Gillisia sp.]
MDTKSYIAVFFALIFFGKFLMLDAKFLEGILDSNEIAYVNPFCEKNNTEVSESGIFQDLLPESKTQSISIDNFCNAPFHFEIVTWEHMFEQPTFQFYSYTTPGTPQIFQDRFYPPPKVV